MLDPSAIVGPAPVDGGDTAADDGNRITRQLTQIGGDNRGRAGGSHEAHEEHDDQEEECVFHDWRPATGDW